MKKSALETFKKHSSKAKRRDLAKKKCGKEDNRFYKSSSGMLSLYTVLVRVSVNLDVVYSVICILCSCFLLFNILFLQAQLSLLGHHYISCIWAFLLFSLLKRNLT
jgi:hypothetical protein